MNMWRYGDMEMWRCRILCRCKDVEREKDVRVGCY